MTFAVAEFASRPWVQRAIKMPRDPNSVLSFFLGFDVKAVDASEKLKSGSYVQDMQPLWFTSNVEFDDLCNNFSPVVREAGKGTLKGQDWLDIKGKVAKLILCDQLSRNCFRGTDEAFFYDNTSLTLANDLAELAFKEDEDWMPSYTFFVVLAFMHSENIHDHEVADKLLKKAMSESWCPFINWNYQNDYLIAHTNVIRKFGHYPHRNSKKGRQTTPEELDWLNSDECPSWAKSQG
jgi:uncharacterized protein (DUF924 family)